ncbi:MAG TPA: glycosyltransferase family 39 protein [bacterium]|nr:glycosyltransferase family 39 protein [bacterium]
MKNKNLLSNIVFFSVLCVAAALLFQGISHSFDGYLAYNEAWYSLIAEHYGGLSSFMFPTVKTGLVDLNLPPFFSYLLHIVFRISGGSEPAYRLVPILSSLFSLVLIYLTGKKLFSKKAGIIAAALAGTSPVFILTGRNIQTDATYLCLALASFYFFIRATNEKSIKNWLVSGLFLGLSLFTKQFAGTLFIIYAVVLVLSAGGAKNLNRKFIALIATAVIIPGVFYLYHLLLNPEAIYASQRFGAAGLAEIPSLNQFSALIVESLFAIGPLFFILTLIAIPINIINGEIHREKIIPFSLTAFFCFFLVFHKHSYYVYSVVPFAALFCGAALDKMKSRVSIPVLLPVVTVSILGGLLVLGTLKFGYQRFPLDICSKSSTGETNHALIVEHGILANYEPVLDYYCRNMEIFDIDALKKGPSRRISPENEKHVYLLIVTDAVPDEESSLLTTYYRTPLGFSLFGFGIGYIPTPNRSFTPARLVFDRNAPVKWGYYPIVRFPSFLLTDIPFGYHVSIENGKIEVLKNRR